MDHTITLGSIIGIITVITGVTAILMHSRKVRRENEADAKARNDELKAEIGKHNDSVEKRLTTAETKIADFMPRAEIEQKIEHEKNNRSMADNALKERSDRHDRDISDIKVSVGRLDQKQDGMSGELHEMKALIKDMSRDLNAKLDKQAECLNSLSRKAA